MNRLLPWLFLAVTLALLECTIRMGGIPAFLVPRPSDVFRALIDDLPTFSQALFSTFQGSLWGFTLSFLVGGTTALIFSSVPILRKALLPFAVFFQTVPIVALAPVLVIWFGFGMPTVVASSFICSVFPIIANTLLGLDSVEPDLLDLFRIYRARPLTVLLKLRVPHAIPQVFVGMQIASGLAVIGAIVGEFVAGGGLGGVIDAARTQNRLDKVFAAVLLSTLLGALWVAAVNALSKHRNAMLSSLP